MAALWLTRRRWLPFIQKTLPPKLIASLAGFTNSLAWLSPRADKKLTPPLLPYTPDELRKTSGGSVNWIDRGQTNPNQLAEFHQLIITGAMKVGKSREAAELIRRTIRREAVHPDRVFKLSADFPLYTADGLQQAIRKVVNPGPAILLFIDDFPRLFSDEVRLQRLGAALTTMRQEYAALYLVASARSDKLLGYHQNWLDAQDFAQVELPTLNASQMERLIDSAAGVYRLQIEADARQVLVTGCDGRPEHLIIAFNLLEYEKFTTVDVNTAKQYIHQDLLELWKKTRLAVEGQNPAARYIFSALDSFYAAETTADSGLTLAYALDLWHQEESGLGLSRRLLPRRRMAELLQTLNKLAFFDIIEREEDIHISEAAVEGRLDGGVARQRLAEFLISYRRTYQKPFLAWLYPHSAAHARTLFGLAVFAQKRKQYTEAISLYSAALSLMPHPDMYNKRGTAYIERDDYRAALDDFNQALRLDPQNASAHFNRGLAYGRLEQYQAALDDYTEAIRINPEYASAYSNRGFIYAKLQNYQAALDDCTRAIQLDPGEAEAYSNRGLAYRELKNYRAALDYYDEAIRLNPTDPSVYLNRGDTYYELKDYQAALADYTEAIRFNPASAGAYYRRAAASYALNNYQDALDDYSQAIRLNPADAKAYSTRGAIYDELDDYRAAIADYTQSIRIDPGYATAYYNRALTYYGLEEYQAALADYTEAIRLDSEDAAAYYNRGLTYEELGEYRAALDDFTSSIRLDSGDATAYYHRGLTYTRLEYYRAALDDYSEAIRLDPEYAQAYYGKASIYALRNDSDQACFWLRQAIDLDAEYIELVQEDPDFDLISNSPEFQDLINP